MTQKDLIKKLTAHRGPVFVEVVNFHDAYWLQAVKSDVIVQIKAKFGADDETGFELDDNGYLSKDYKVSK